MSKSASQRLMDRLWPPPPPLPIVPPRKPETIIEMADRLAGDGNITITSHKNGTVTIEGEPPKYLRISGSVMEIIRKEGAGSRSYHDGSGVEYITLGLPYAAEYEVLGVVPGCPWYVVLLVKSKGAWDDEVEKS